MLAQQFVGVFCIFFCCGAKTESLGARRVPFREVYSLPEVFLLKHLGVFQPYIRSKYSSGVYHFTIIVFSQFLFGH